MLPAPEPAQIHISTAFFPAAVLPGVPEGQHCDLVLHASDSVFFYCHQSILRSKSTNNFGDLLPNPNVQPGFLAPAPGQTSSTAVPRDRSISDGPVSISPHRPTLPRSLSLGSEQVRPDVVWVPEVSTTINILLHEVYGLPFERYAPDLETLGSALDASKKYGCSVTDTKSKIWSAILRWADRHPIRVYAIAATHAMDSVCIAASEHTLAVPLSMVSEADAYQMGALYLRRLFFLHMGRADALKRILALPRVETRLVPGCPTEHETLLRLNWRAAEGDLMMTNLPECVSASQILAAFGTVVAKQYDYVGVLRGGSEKKVRPAFQHSQFSGEKRHVIWALRKHHALISHFALQPNGLRNDPTAGGFEVPPGPTSVITDLANQRPDRGAKSGSLTLSGGYSRKGHFRIGTARFPTGGCALVSEEVVTTTETSTEEGTIHQQQLRSVSQLFAVTVPEIATVFNIVLHVIYGLEFRRYGPSLTIMSEALISLAKYGAPPLQTGSEMYTLLAKAIDTQPLQVYAIGAYWNLEAVCLAASEKTLGLSLSMLSEADAIMTGPLYLRRLFFLHLGRISALQRVTESPPEEHPDHPGCTGAQREPLRKLWRAGRATLLMRELPQNASVQDVVLIFGSLIGETTCLDCKAKVHARV
ncbi:hypothetical protein FRB90_001912, partial [Tulasnella sp. 427]